MSAPQMSEQKEQRRRDIVNELGVDRLQNEPALDRVAEAVAEICEVDSAHVSMMQDATQCVVGHVGVEEETFAREDAFCAYTIAQNEVFVVENAAEDSRFADNPYVQFGPQIRFYLGLPVVVDDVPVGTMCALDSTPRNVPYERRSELFAALSAVEAHLRVRYQYGPDSFESALAGKLLDTRAWATTERYRNDIGETSRELVCDIESGLVDSVCRLEIEQPSPANRLAFAETDVEGT